MAFYGKVDGEWRKLSNFNTYKEFSLVTCDSNAELKRIVEDGTAESWTFSGHTDTVSDVVLDENLNSFTASSDETVRKISDTGQEIWSFSSTGTNFASVSVGPEGYVYAGDASGLFRKISRDGQTEEWQFAASGNVNGIDVGPGGNIYIAAGSDIQKVDPQGNEIWSFVGHNRVINGVTVAEDGAVYTAAFGSDGTVKKVTSNGNEDWSFENFSSTVNDSAVNRTTGAVYGVAGGEIRKFDNDGNQQFEYTSITGSIRTAEVDKNGFLYIGGNDQNVYKLEDTGTGFNQVFTFQAHNGTIQGNSVNIIT